MVFFGAIVVNPGHTIEVGACAQLNEKFLCKIARAIGLLDDVAHVGGVLPLDLLDSRPLGILGRTAQDEVIGTAFDFKLNAGHQRHAANLPDDRMFLFQLAQSFK